MEAIEQLEIRLLDESDIPAAMKLKESAGWNQTEDDWRCLLELEPHGCFGATLDGELVGTTTTTTYADKLAWVGMVLVQPERRRLGIASKLLTVALDYLAGKVATVKLDATPAGKHVYEGFGFQTEGLIERWSGVAASSSVDGSVGPLIDDNTRQLVIDLDQKAFKADRSKLIEILMVNSSARPLVARTEGGVTGYALARRGSKADYIGPLVAKNTNEVEPLIDGLLSQMAGRSVYIDFNTSSICESTVLSRRGFKKERGLIRMHYGKQSYSTSPFVIAIAGPEVG